MTSPLTPYYEKHRATFADKTIDECLARANQLLATYTAKDDRATWLERTGEYLAAIHHAHDLGWRNEEPAS
jgi:hypothetical protein